MDSQVWAAKIRLKQCRILAFYGFWAEGSANHDLGISGLRSEFVDE